MSSPSLRDQFDQRVFDAIYSRSLVYNTCWEDPAVDRRALALSCDDTVLVITSAGCNALDYALQGPKSIYAVDANPRQTALLELKMAGIRCLSFSDFFSIFGDGYHPQFRKLYRERLRGELSPFAQDWWDRHDSWFTSRRGSFYFHGLSGLVARGVRAYLAARPRLRRAVNDLIDAGDIATQRRVYDEQVAPLLWNRAVNWVISRQFMMSLLGVPFPQRKLVEAQHRGGVAGYIRDSVQYVFRQLPFQNNYFWRVHITGRYDRDCCPEYLKKDNFERLKDGLVDRIQAHTATVTDFLAGHDGRISRYVLLDHMDWMSAVQPAALTAEWEAILAHAASGARILLRSAHKRPEYLDQIRVGSQQKPLREVLCFMDEVAETLQAFDRVHTYAGFVIADAPA